MLLRAPGSRAPPTATPATVPGTISADIARKNAGKTKVPLLNSLSLLSPSSRTTTTIPRAVTPACCATATLSARSPEPATERAASVIASLASSGVSVIAVTTRLLKFLPTAVKV
ncbi:hypothetical protein XENOCAPTIV_016767 [Xenoophorus captivus]|uniref:Uncharacterized protein n=1 Tax=Xenoophorus captivus TaxID=1517983 RepID=A0ABV0R446_9TELE